MNLEDIKLSAISQSEKENDLTYMWNLKTLEI
jgi:hypothetical protein